MKPQIDLFHQLIYEADGYQAFLIVDDEPWPCVKVYQPDGRCCGGTNAQNHYTRLAAIRETIKINKQWRSSNERKNIKEVKEGTSFPSETS